jgi:DNA-binding SARP family transcriptional activator
LAELRPHLRKRIEDADPRVVRIIAPAGYGKTTLASALVASSGGVVCDLAELAGLADLERRISDALDLPKSTAGAGGVIERWRAAGPRSWFVIDGVDAALSIPGGAELLRLLVRTLPAERRLILTARNPIPFELTRSVTPHELLTLTEADLAFDIETRRAVIGATPLAPEVLDRAVRLSRGWPIATLLFARLAREGALAALVDRLDDDRFADLHAYVDAHILGELDPATYQVVLACTAIPDATVDDIATALGYDSDAVRAKLDDGRAPIARSGETCRVNALVAAAVRRTAADEIRALQAAYAAELAAHGRPQRAAELLLHAGDGRAAAAAFDAIGPLPPGERASPRAMRFVALLPLAVVLASRHALDVLLTCVQTRAAPFELLERMRIFRAALEPDADPALRASARLAHGVLLRIAQRSREADAVLREAADDEQLAAERRPVLAANRAVIAARLGRLGEARRIWSEARLDDDAGRTAFVLERIELELFMALPAGEFPTIFEAHMAEIHAVEHEAADPIVALFARAMDVLYRRLSGEIGTAAAFLRAVDAQTAGRPELAHLVLPADPATRSASVWTIVATLDMALQQTDVETARRLVNLAIGGADATGMPHFRASTRIVAAFVPGNDAARMFAEALAAAREVDEPRLAASVEAIAAGKVPSDGPFRTLLAKIERSPFIVAVSSLRIALLRGEVTRAGVVLPIRARDFELLAALALARGPLTRDALSERLWPDGAEDENPALRMSVHRLRRQLAEPDALVTEGTAYRLGPTVAVDIDEIEMFLGAVRQLRALSEDQRGRLGQMFGVLAAPLPDRYTGWEWFAPHAARLGDLRSAVGTVLAGAFLQAGRPEDALGIAEALLRFDPADEPATELAIRAHLAAGRRAEATRAFRRYREFLATEFEAEPSAELARLVRSEPAAGDAVVTAPQPEGASPSTGVSGR